MTDVENEVYTSLVTGLRERFNGINTSSSYVREPKSFPFVSVVEMDNYTSEDRLDTSDDEKYATLMYQVDVYSNSPTKKSDCKAIMQYVHSHLHKRNFTRLSCLPTPNLENSTVYRMTARYRVETDGEYFYRK